MEAPGRHLSSWGIAVLNRKEEQLSYPRSSNQSQRLNPNRVFSMVYGNVFSFQQIPGVLDFVMFFGRKKGKRLPEPDKTLVEPSSKKLLENFGHEIPKNAQRKFAQEPASVILALKRNKISEFYQGGNCCQAVSAGVSESLGGNFFSGSFLGNRQTRFAMGKR